VWMLPWSCSVQFAPKDYTKETKPEVSSVCLDVSGRWVKISPSWNHIDIAESGNKRT
jgi:hypothetical protein